MQKEKKILNAATPIMVGMLRWCCFIESHFFLFKKKKNEFMIKIGIYKAKLVCVVAKYLHSHLGHEIWKVWITLSFFVLGNSCGDPRVLFCERSWAEVPRCTYLCHFPSDLHNQWHLYNSIFNRYNMPIICRSHWLHSGNSTHTSYHLNTQLFYTS